MTRLEPDGDDWAVLIGAAKAGDVPARQRLLLRHHASLLGLIRAELNNKLRDILDPEDVLQEVYSEALRRFDGFDGETTDVLRHWIHAVGRNKVRELHRNYLQTEKRAAGFDRRAVSAPFSQTSVSLIAALQAHGATASQKAVRVEALDALAAALVMLPPHYREVLELRYLQGRSVEATAEAVGATKGAVLMTCHRAMRQMTKLISDFPLLTKR